MSPPNSLLSLRASSSSARLASGLRQVQQRKSQWRRHLHQARELPYDASQGLQPLFSKETLDMLAVEYQNGLLERLNEQVKGTASQNASVVQTVINAAKDRNQILAFNLASEALNNSYFLSRLTPDAQRQRLSDTSELAKQIRDDFGDLQQFQVLFSAAASGMSGSGYLWLVMDQKKQLGILPTFGAGTPLIQARHQRGDQDLVLGEGAKQSPLPSESAASSGQAPTPAGHEPSKESQAAQKAQMQVEWLEQENRAAAQAAARTGSGRSSQSLALGELNPLMCLSVHERAWLRDFGVWGKEQYIQQWFKVLDWSRVDASYTKLSGGARRNFHT